MSDSIPPAATGDMLNRFAQRLETDAQFMAGVLARYRRQERLTEAELAAQLGISMPMYTRLALCKLPAADRPAFARQVTAIAEYVGCDAGQLAQLINQAAAIAGIPPADAEAAAPRPAPAPTANFGWLAAARDREPDAAAPGDDQDVPANPDEVKPE